VGVSVSGKRWMRSVYVKWDLATFLSSRDTDLPNVDVIVC
jgi:hypothetical protein